MCLHCVNSATYITLAISATVSEIAFSDSDLCSTYFIFSVNIIMSHSTAPIYRLPSPKDRRKFLLNVADRKQGISMPEWHAPHLQYYW